MSTQTAATASFLPLGTLLHLLLLSCAGGILVFRYVLDYKVAEFLCWLVLICVEVLPRLNAFTQLTQFSSAPSFWDSPAGVTLLQAYETAVFNEYIDADDWLNLALGVVLLIFLVRQCRNCYNYFCETCCCREPQRSRRGGRERKYRKVRPANEESDEDDYDDEEERELRRSRRERRERE